MHLFWRIFTLLSVKFVLISCTIFEKNPTVCATRKGNLLTSGFCNNLSTCLLNGGQKVGTCAGSRICCQIQKTCDGIITSKYSYIISEDYNNQTATVTSCRNIIRRYNKKTCQVKLDFAALTLDAPSNTGLCDAEYLQIDGTHPNYFVPEKFCGTNSGQHLYLSYPEGQDEITLTIKATNKRWLIQVTQIECQPTANPIRAPAGCLQYFSAASATVNSLTYQTDSDTQYEFCIAKSSSTCAATYAIQLLNLPDTNYVTPVGPFCDTPGTTISNVKNFIRTGADCVTSGSYLEIKSTYISRCQLQGAFPNNFLRVAGANVYNHFCGDTPLGHVVSLTSRDYRVRVKIAAFTQLSRAFSITYAAC